MATGSSPRVSALLWVLLADRRCSCCGGAGVSGASQAFAALSSLRPSRYGPPLSQGAFQMLRKHHIDLVFLCVHAECNFNFLSGKKVTSLHVFATQMAWALQ